MGVEFNKVTRRFTMSTKQTSPRILAVLLLLVIGFAAIAIYSSVALTEESSNVRALQRTVAELQARNSQLEINLSSLSRPQSNVTVYGIDPARIYGDSNRSVVTIQGSEVTIVDTLFGPQRVITSVLGSGFVIDYSNSYYLITNFHVVDGIVNATVTFWNGEAYPAKIVGSDAYSDIAVIATQASHSEFYPVGFAPSYSLVVGQPVVAIGNPFGLSGSVTFGIVSQLGRTIQYQSARGGFSIADVIQFSAPINPGNSGGPLLDINGMVVGMTTAVVSGSQGVGFAIPSDTILRELPSLVSSGKYEKHPYIGFQGVDMNYQLSQVMGTNATYGVLIEKTVTGGPAEKAQLRGGQQIATIDGQQYLIGGDIIISIDGNRIVNYDALSTYLERHTIPGQTIRVGVIRSGSYLEVQVTLGGY
jgi:S1-C subfamily serine protease